MSESEKKTCNRRCLECKQFFIISNNKSCTRNIFVHYINTQQSHGTTERGCFHGQKCLLYDIDLGFWLILGSDNCQKMSWLHLSTQNPLMFIPDQRTLIIKRQNHNRNMVFLNYLRHDKMTAANIIVFSIFDWCCRNNSTAKNKKKKQQVRSGSRDCWGSVFINIQTSTEWVYSHFRYHTISRML